MRFDPKTEEEIAAANLLEGGDYDFEVMEATEQSSRAGNDMVKLKLGIPMEDGGHRIIFDYLVGTEGAQFKLRHFAESTGLLGHYERGEMNAEDMVGRAGVAKVGIQKDKSGQYPDKNVIRDYVPAAVPSVAPIANGKGKAPAAAMVDDDIPFEMEWR